MLSHRRVFACIHFERRSHQAKTEYNDSVWQKEHLKISELQPNMDRRSSKTQPVDDNAMRPPSRSSSPPQYAPSSSEPQQQMYSPQGQQYHSNQQLNAQQAPYYSPNPQMMHGQPGQQYAPNHVPVQPYPPPMLQYGPPPPQQQFMQSSQQVVIVNQPGATQEKGLRVCDKIGHRDWSSGLCGCFSDCASTCKVMCCFQATLCDLSTRTGDCCCTALCMPAYLPAYRARIRTMGGIQGDICYDILAIGCCSELALCQMMRELDAMGL
ncbi:uncharacterized protein LOC127853152 isoform X2 [Dreissena polymorpha]|uniref:uncharacterized protein LOC127853152 isoform X2 n=1 Tax=Dreissena polymorpha TaxID=45954 RepID=UPI002265177C|nr:uncharacterized protein LOC127853152 isoform X2 [Dreissena polymorpha]